MDNSSNNQQDLQEAFYLKELHKGKNTVATVLGIISLFGCLGPISMACGIVAIIIGAKAKKLSNNATGNSGFVLGITGTALSAPLTLFLIFEFLMAFIAMIVMLFSNGGAA